MSVKQNTLKGEFSLKGKGLHTLSRQRKIPDIKLSESISKRKPRFRHWRNILNW